MNIKYIVAFYILAFFVCEMHAKNIVDTSADRGLMVRQIPNTEKSVAKYFSSVDAESDTIYATIFRPANCPRCDGFLNIINDLIKETTTKPSVLVAVYPDSLAAIRYIKEHELKSDYYKFDTDESFSDFLSFSPGYLHVGYILKINKKTGELIIGSNADNVSRAFFKELNVYNKRKEQYEFPGNNPRYHDWGEDLDEKLECRDTYIVNMPDSVYSLSEIIYQPVFYENQILWNDKLAMSVAEFELNDSSVEFKRLILPDSLEYSKFVSLPNDRYNSMLQSGQLKNIPLQPFIINNDRFGIAYSLPELWIDEQDRLCYRNKPCYITRSFSDLDFKSLTPLEYDFEDVFYYPHFDMKSLGESDVVVGVQRITWPMVTDKEEYASIPESNPFMDEFYDNYPQPTLATYDNKSGLLKRRFGSLPHFAKKAKTGYSYSDMIFDAWEDEVVYGSVYEGSIVLTSIDNLDCEACNKTYKAFEIDESLIQMPDTSDYYSYNCTALVLPLLNRKITDLKCDDFYIHCLVRNCTDAFERPEIETYNYVLINRATGERKMFAFPDRREGERRIGYGLRRMIDGSVTPYYITKDFDSWLIKTVSPGTTI